jgi:hypothetical protein
VMLRVLTSTTTGLAATVGAGGGEGAKGLLRTWCQSLCFCSCSTCVCLSRAVGLDNVLLN